VKPSHYEDFSSWFADMGLKITNRDFQETEIKNIGKWLKPFAGSKGQTTVLLDAFKDFSGQIRNDPETCCGAMIVALATQSRELVDYAAYNWGELLFFHGKSGLLVLAYRMLGDYDYGDKLRALMATALVVRGIIPEALKLWSLTEKKAVEKWGWTCLAEAATAFRSGQKEQAKNYYKKAVAAFLREKNQRMAIVSRIYLGIIYLGETDYEKSKQLYVEILKGQTKENLLSDNFLGVLHGNLGIIEFRQAAFTKAVADLELGARLSLNVANQTAYIMILFYQALTEFYLGKFVAAYHIAQQAWRIKQKTGSTFLRSEHPALLASLAQYLGKTEDSDYWISKLDNKNSSEEVVINLAKARGLLFRQKIPEAIKLLEETRKHCDKTVNPIIVSRAFVLLALLSDNHAELINPDRISVFEKGTAEFLYAELLSLLLESPSNPDKSKLEKLFHEFNALKTYDPMWFLVFSKVADLKLKNAQGYFIWQYSFSSSFIRSFARIFFKNSAVATGLIEKVPAGADEECISLGAVSIEVITRREYNLVAENEKAAHPFFFDGIGGKIYIFSNIVSLKNNSVQARLLSFMLQSHSRRVLLKSAYEFIWGSKYSEFYDDAVVKTTVARINKLIGKHSATFLIRIVSIQLTNYLEIKLPEQWHAFLPVK
jgi:tetratricopeptide (TPR) repeat protein